MVNAQAFTLVVTMLDALDDDDETLFQEKTCCSWLAVYDIYNGCRLECISLEPYIVDDEDEDARRSDIYSYDINVDLSL